MGVWSVLFCSDILTSLFIEGLPTIFGLYASTVPPFMYALFGTSSELSFGPIAVTSLILERGLAKKLSFALFHLC